jgi:exosortase
MMWFSSVPMAMSRRGWKLAQFVVGGLLLAAGFVVTAPAWLDMVHIALRDEESSHILLVPIVFIWLVWVRRQRLRYCVPTGMWVGPIVVALGWFLLSFGDLRLYQSVWHFGAIMVIVGCFISMTGIGVLKRFLPAFAVLLFLIPVPALIRQEIALPMQRVTAEVTQRVLELFWIDTVRSGSRLTINGVDVAIAEACNGLRMVFALVLVSFVFAYGTPLREFVRITILLASPISAIVCNVIRLVPTVWLFGNTSTSLAESFHDVSGWIMLPLAFLMLMGIVRLMRWALIPVYRYSLAYGA